MRLLVAASRATAKLRGQREPDGGANLLQSATKPHLGAQMLVEMLDVGIKILWLVAN